MYKLPSALGPHQVGAGDEVAMRVAILAGAVLGIAAAGILGIEQVLPRLGVLDAALAEDAVELAPRHGKLLGNLCRFFWKSEDLFDLVGGGLFNRMRVT